jgi:hypothetical protein
MAKSYTLEEVIEKLRIFIAVNYHTQDNAAYEWHVTPGAITNYLKGRRPIPDRILADIGFERETGFRRKR